MTANVQNTSSSFYVLERALKDFSETEEMSAEAKLKHIAILMDSFRKCMNSLAAQVRHYESAKNTGRALIVENENGDYEIVDGMQMNLLSLPLPNTEQDAVIYGRPEILTIVSKALTMIDWPSLGPGTSKEIAAQASQAKFTD